jgi:putative flippase GtrA
VNKNTGGDAVLERIQLIFGKYRETILYIVFGVLTTLVNYLVYFPFFNLLCFSAAASNIIAWCAAVVFAFVTNKIFVFCSNIWHIKVVLAEAFRFFLCRVFSGLLETGLLFLTVDFLQWNGNSWKIVLSVVVVILNYFASKVFVFAKVSE